MREGKTLKCEFEVGVNLADFVLVLCWDWTSSQSKDLLQYGNTSICYLPTMHIAYLDILIAKQEYLPLYTSNVCCQIKISTVTFQLRHTSLYLNFTTVKHSHQQTVWTGTCDRSIIIMELTFLTGAEPHLTSHQDNKTTGSQRSCRQRRKRDFYVRTELIVPCCTFCPHEEARSLEKLT